VDPIESWPNGAGEHAHRRSPGVRRSPRRTVFTRGYRAETGLGSEAGSPGGPHLRGRANDLRREPPNFALVGPRSMTTMTLAHGSDRADHGASRRSRTKAIETSLHRRLPLFSRGERA
jgi:hypothetical protein